MADLEAQPVPGTDGATSPFWSPNSRSLAFFADHQLKRIELPTGAPVPICDIKGTTLSHGTWGRDDTILMGEPNGETIYSVPAAGGTLRETLTRNRSNGEARVGWPWFLPDGKHFLYTARLDDGEGEVRFAQLRPNDRKGNARPVQLEDTRTVMSASSNAQWVDPDVVVFARGSLLMGQRWDVETARTIGEPFSIAQRVDYFPTTSRAMFSASQTGNVAYHAGEEMGQLVWADRNGNEGGSVGSPAEYDPSGRLSKDETQLLTARSRAGLGTYDIWRLNLVTGHEEQLTFNPGSEVTPVWIERERAILYAGDSSGRVPHLFRKDLATRTPEEEVLPPGRHQLVMDVFPDGRVAYLERSGEGRFQPFQLSLTRDATPAPLLQSPLSTQGMRLSPDGLAMTYVGVGAVGGRGSIYVARVSITDRPTLVPGGVAPRNSPRWGTDGGQIYYVSPDDVMMMLTVQTVPSLKVGKPKQLFKLRRSASLFEVSRDGRFLLLVHLVRADQRPIVVDTAGISSTRR
jgi:Tol biopolymer transport system component